MQFESTHITGKGRGKPMGFPTINLKVPANFKLKDGVYAVKVIIGDKIFKGALHYGATPTFSETEKSLEVYLIELNGYEIDNLEDNLVKVEIIERLRDVKKFRLVEDLVKQIELDVKRIKEIKI